MPMHLSAHVDAIRKPLELASLAIHYRNHHPTAQFVHCRADHDRVTLSATDGEVGLCLHVEHTTVGKPGEALLGPEVLQTVKVVAGPDDPAAIAG
jgi:DNA polymerase III sliding clamp (beta) subunit (PCNA family)